jgi:hypothetical protein
MSSVLMLAGFVMAFFGSCMVRAWASYRWVPRAGWWLRVVGLALFLGGAAWEAGWLRR